MFDFDAQPPTPVPGPTGKTADRVLLEKAYSWQQTYNRYPFYLAKAEPNRTYTFDEVYTVVFQTRPPGRKKDGSPWVRNTFGLELDVAAGQPVARGIGLLKKVVDDGYRLSPEAIELGGTFAENRYNDEWLRVFAAILARNDIRTRCILYYLGRLGCSLQFPKTPAETGFFEIATPTLLLHPAGPALSLFNHEPSGSPRYSFTPILQNVAYAAFGPFLRANLETLGMSLARQVLFVGALSKGTARTEPSSSELNTYLKQTLSIFKDLRVIVYAPAQQTWCIDYARARATFPAEIIADLFTSDQADPFLEHLRHVYLQLADADGLASVRQMRDWVCDLLGVPAGERIHYFNERVAHYLSPDQGRLSIVKEFHAQASPEDCLFYDLGKEYVAFSF
jgi:hypothetical protein